MKYASAMKYGGELVDAIDCDYNSFKELVPLCPSCKEPVYLRSGGQRESVKGKAYQIGPHWCHFKGISAEQVAGCELRVNDYTEKDRAKIAAQARGQRLKLLQRWFARILRDNPFLDYSDKIEKGIASGMGPANYSRLVDAVCKDIKKNKDLARKFIENRTAEQIRLASSPDGEPITPKTHEYLERWFSSDLEFSTNKKIALEVLDFILSKGGHPILSLLVADSLAEYKFAGPANPPPLSKISILVVGHLLLIPWASEFQRLEAEAKQRKDAA